MADTRDTTKGTRGKAAIIEDVEEVERAPAGGGETIQNGNGGYKSRRSRAGTRGGCPRQYRREEGKAAIKVEEVERAPEGGASDNTESERERRQ